MKIKNIKEMFDIFFLVQIFIDRKWYVIKSTAVKEGK